MLSVIHSFCRGPWRPPSRIDGLIGLTICAGGCYHYRDQNRPRPAVFDGRSSQCNRSMCPLPTGAMSACHARSAGAVLENCITVENIHIKLFSDVTAELPTEVLRICA